MLIGQLIYCKSKSKFLVLKCRSTHTRFPVDSHDRELLSNILFVCVCTENELGETALDVSRRLKHGHCEALVRRRSAACLYMWLLSVTLYIINLNRVVSLQLQQAQSNQFDHHVNVEYEWRLRHDDLYDSDDDFEERVTMATSRLYCFFLSFFLYNYSLLLELALSRFVNHS